MPKEVFGHDFRFLERNELLTFEETARLVRLFLAAGGEKGRVTGGERLLRRDLERLVELIAPMPGLRDLTLTTNGSLLAQKARPLADAGLRRVTVSLDSLDDDVFRRMNDVDFPVWRMLDEEMPLEPVPANYPGEVADRWRYRDGDGEVGVIASVTQPFCRDCTRARLSAEGELYTCLFAVSGHDLRAPLRDGEGDEALTARIAAISGARTGRYSEQRSADTAELPKVEMSRIGG